MAFERSTDCSSHDLSSNLATQTAGFPVFFWSFSLKGNL